MNPIRYITRSGRKRAVYFHGLCTVCASRVESEYVPDRRRVRTCSAKCRADETMRGRRSLNWKGGRTRNGNGYALLHVPEHPDADRDGYVVEHRYLMERLIGRPLERSEHVHHRNHDRSDNRLSNLELLTAAEHGKRHAEERWRGHATSI